MEYRNTFYDSEDLSLLREYCRECGRVEHYARREVFLHAGAPADRMAYIDRGSICYSFCGFDGREYTGAYGFRGGFAVDYELTSGGELTYLCLQLKFLYQNGTLKRVFHTIDPQ